MEYLTPEIKYVRAKEMTYMEKRERYCSPTFEIVSEIEFERDIITMSVGEETDGDDNEVGWGA